MKNILNLFALIACFTFLASSAFAQQQIRNYTNCEFTVKVAIGQDGCDDISFQVHTVGPTSNVIITLGTGESIQYAKGRYTGSNCAFYVGLTCSGYNLSTSIDCNTDCEDYNARLYPWGIQLQN